MPSHDFKFSIKNVMRLSVCNSFYYDIYLFTQEYGVRLKLTSTDIVRNSEHYVGTLWIRTQLESFIWCYRCCLWRGSGRERKTEIQDKTEQRMVGMDNKCLSPPLLS